MLNQLTEVAVPAKDTHTAINDDKISFKKEHLNKKIKERESGVRLHTRIC